METHADMQNTHYKNKLIKYTTQDKIKIAIVVLMILYMLYMIITTSLIVLLHRDFKPKDFDEQAYYLYDDKLEISRDEAKRLCNEHFGFTYLLIETPLRHKGLLGRAIPNYGIILVDNSIDGWELVKTLAHELCHIKYYTANETFTEYMTFVELYESDNYILKQVALNLANEHCYDKRHYNTKYDVAWYINDYLGG